MRTHIRTTLVALVMTCTTVTSAGRAAQQSPTQGSIRFAYEACWKDLEEWGVLHPPLGRWIRHACGVRRRSAEMVARRYPGRFCERHLRLP